MARWQPGTREKLHAAAMELFTENGYDQTTASDIAASVGLTERTFFRHFADKREVLFDRQQELTDLITTGVLDAETGAGALDLAEAGLSRAARFFEDEGREAARARQRLLDRTPALEERERLKLAELASALHDALAGCGITEPAATLAAESAITVFKATLTQWLRDGETRDFGTIAAQLFTSLRALSTET